MKHQISAYLAPVDGQISVHLRPIDSQSKTAQTSAQIVRNRKYAITTLSSGYTSHAKQKKCTYPNRATAIFWMPFSPFIPVLYRFYTRLYLTEKYITSIRSAFQRYQITGYTPDLQFSDFIPSSIFMVPVNFPAARATLAEWMEKKKGLRYLKPSVKTGDLVRIQT